MARPDRIRAQHVTYVNGRAGTREHWESRVTGMRPADRPQRLVFPRIRAAIDQLHVSDVMRYKGDFDPPARNAPVIPDANTRAYFAFDGILDGQSGNGRPVTGILDP